VRGIFKGVLVEHLSVPAAALATVFPGSDAVKPQRDLFRA
jgi:uncharacterized protein (DUF1501 family)